MSRRLEMALWKLHCAWCDIQTAFGYLVRGVDDDGRMQGIVSAPIGPGRQSYPEHPKYGSFSED